MSIDYVTAFRKYNVRFEDSGGPQAIDAYTKFGKHMVQRLDSESFVGRLDKYVKLHAACRRMLQGGSTISDALVLEFDEAAAWVAVRAPDIYGMFRGEMGRVDEAAPMTKETTMPEGAK